MSAPGSTNHLGVSNYTGSFTFKIPTVPTGGTNRDMGTLALMLVANWFINGRQLLVVDLNYIHEKFAGETVLIDGGTLLQHPASF